MKLTTLDTPMAAGRAFLTSKEESPELLEQFEASLVPLRRAPAELRREVGEHAEFLQNSGRLRQEAVPGFRAALEEYAIGHRDRMLTVLAAHYESPNAGGAHAARLAKLRQVIALERARGV